ncbi:TIGR04283 family arsenosugar biosynthesis glycosyltransferase [Synechococcus sp. J7-Johnson]|uniref:TIGR04283 family arsenosugar biosynthesis glycosyltransferase n=1 Tax=Synechococcus sp. J7-Johnson TaxID=2823737 RepID=UPI0020CF4D53|nr:TIGR04283 family arsenosugar biosynthesis glycosyltransferase [Synechococcus sp. J7-Johnson]MCP9840222.1 TIGR04283 family arsenosugar biosynthesis glycosyltransferase [Synechococcus sp. J7-Johnson]
MRATAAPTTVGAPLAVVIPALNEAGHLPALLADLAMAPAGLIDSCLVVDGGSRDGSPSLSALAGARVMQAAGGRGCQLAAGVARSRAAWLLLLHADLRLAPGWWSAVQRAMAAPETPWCFRLGIQGAGPALRLVEWGVRLRSGLGQLPYGDQGLLLPRRLLERAGGLRALPLMEDLDLILRLRQLGPIRDLGLPVQVDGRRWRRLGVWSTAWRNARLRQAWRRGADPATLAARYYQL